ncbi:glycerate kinase [Nocardia sp. 348MFTsu5.1]|uniref:glycerate kinase n=1 Tax=Nocardia sp. 348MFTsu5.1 TaxID=1172185 RepID=UPI00036A9121|nr:glycerate kinase [Nocardia sp. 348MFTsu5.1]
MKVLIAPDKFKGSLSAGEVADRLAAGLARAGASSTQLPLADGGDGSVDAAIAAGFTPHQVTVAGATGHSHSATLAFNEGTVLVEVANTCGLATLPDNAGDALGASSLGLGQAIRAGLQLGKRRMVLALGGSASTDGGMGMLTALGHVFRDTAGHALQPSGRNMSLVHTVDSTHALDLRDIDVVVATDVTNPLTGPIGAATVYGPQKGASDDDVRLLDAGLDNLVATFERSGHPRASQIAGSSGAGSAGGIGFAAMILGGHVVSGAGYFLDLLDFDNALTGVDLVITGEGSIDDQTEHGKLLTVLIDRARPTPVIGVAGRTTLPRDRWSVNGFEWIYALADLTTENTSRDPALTRRLLEHIGHKIALNHDARLTSADASA